MASAIVFGMEKKTEFFSQAINFLLTGLRIYKGVSIACGPRNAIPSVGHYVGPWALHSPVQIRKPVRKKIIKVVEPHYGCIVA